MVCRCFSIPPASNLSGEHGVQPLPLLTLAAIGLRNRKRQH
jgi:hypothetical protein